MYLFWKAKVALSFQVLALLLLAGNIVYGQSHEYTYPNKKITISLHQLSGEEALQRLARKADVIFIYSTSMLDLEKRVSLNISDQTLTEALKILGQQLSLSFKKEGDYIVVKKIIEHQHSLKAKPVVFGEHESTVNIKNDSIVRDHIFTTTFESHSIFFRKSDYKNTLNKFDSVSSLRTINLLHPLPQPITANERINKKNQWFVSTGLFINDFTLGGFEVQAGLYPFFAVVSASRINNNLYRFGYGAGTMVSLSHRVALQLIYTAAQITKEKHDSVFRDAIKLTSWHHQIKFSAQYAISSKIKLRASVTFNMLNTRFKLGSMDVPISFYRQAERPHVIYLSDVLKSSNTIIVPYALSNSYSDNNYLNTKTWIGCEVGIAYQIKFSSRP